METVNVLGLDLGTNSIGWALIEHTADDRGEPNRPIRVTDAGVRIFQEGVEANKSQSRNVARRDARAARRQHQRRNERRDSLRRLIQTAGLLPEDTAQLQATMHANPYQLRARALDQPVSAFEFGRVLYHLAQRRGFKSNRKADKKADRKESKAVEQGITDLSHEIAQAGARTLGEYLSRLDPTSERVRRRYTSREMYEREFDALWNAQMPHHVPVLTEELREKVRKILFFQRPLRIQKHLVGNCELEPDRKRSPKGTWYAQQFRMLQDLSHLEFADLASGMLRKLTIGERDKLARELGRRKEMTFNAMRKLLGMLDSQRFNFEQADHRDKLKGNSTEWALRRALGDEVYDSMTSSRRDEMVRGLLFVEEAQTIRHHALERWALTEQQADKLADVELQAGYLHLCEKAVKKLLPYLAAGASYAEAVNQAGYQQARTPVRKELLREDMPDLPNPIVMAALHQMRHVVNAIVRTYGKPARVRVEMARDLKVSLGKRAEIIAEQKQNRKRNERIEHVLEEEFKIANPSRQDVTRYRLWEECGKVCPYTGRPIAKEALFGGEWDIEHIWPLDRSGDDSFLNKTLCFADENRRHKHNRTPREAYQSNQARWDEVTARIQRLPWRKRRRFLENIPDDFITRQLNDTRYIARKACAYLETLTGQRRVQIGKGAITADLRRRWGLNRILADSGEKTRADHRHHAVDACVIALTTPTVVKTMSQFAAAEVRPPEGFAPPWPAFRDNVKRRIDTLVVSHRVAQEIRGALHEETNYGILGLKDARNQPLYAVRKKIEALSASEIGQIADPAVREIVRAQFARDATLSAENPPCLPNRQGAPTVPIRRVRLHRTLSNAIPMRGPDGAVYRAVDPGSNHHVAIFADAAGRWSGRFVSMFEAARRARNHEQVVRRGDSAGADFVMSLSRGEMVSLGSDGLSQYWRVQKIDAANRRVTLRLHSSANIDDRDTERTMRLEPFRKTGPRKVTVDPLGRVHRAND